MTTTCLRWRTLEDGSLTSLCSRFDVLKVTNTRHPYWVAYDTNAPTRRVPFTDRESAVAWCEQRAGAKS